MIVRPGARRLPAAARTARSGRRAVLALAVLSTLALAGCGEPALDPSVTRTDAQADQLRERLRTVQAAS